jgi:hypothetical protein
MPFVQGTGGATGNRREKRWKYPVISLKSYGTNGNCLATFGRAIRDVQTKPFRPKAQAGLIFEVPLPLETTFSIL